MSLQTQPTTPIDRPLDEILKAAVIVYQAADITGVDLAIALDHLFEAYTGKSPLRETGLEEDWLRWAGSRRSDEQR